MKDYSDIIELPHYELRYHEKMNMMNRAAQFASFDALDGYKEEIYETGRITTSKKDLTEEEISLLNEQLQVLKPNDKVKITYFIKDSRKAGGKYLTEEIEIKKIDTFTHQIICQNNVKISFNQIVHIQII